jgi:hypothetical protein
VSVDDDLCRWIHDLRGRVERGELADHSPVDVGYGTATMSAERAAKIMLADLDSFDDLSVADRSSSEHTRRRQGLLDDFRRLRELIV